MIGGIINKDLSRIIIKCTFYVEVGVDLPFAGVVVGGAARTALVLVLAAIDAGREGVLSEVVAVRRCSGGRDFAAVLPVRARRVLRRR